MTKRIKVAIVTVSDSRNIENDISGERLGQMLTEFGAEVRERVIVDDDLENVRSKLIDLSDGTVDVVLTTGGTGLAERDNTPEATLEVIEKEAPGISEAMRRETSKFTKFAMLSRGVSGIRNSTLIINLPGSPKGVEECLNVIIDLLPHTVRLIRGDTGH